MGWRVSKRTTPEQKARDAEYARRRRAEDPEFRTRKAEYDRRRYANLPPEAHALRRERRCRQYAEDPEFRARILEHERRQRESPNNRARDAGSKRSRLYGLTPEQYTALYNSQSGLCAICRRRGGAKGLAVDHCHETGVVRGLLCHKCNIGIGNLGDTSAGLMRAVRYLRQARERQQLAMEIEAGEQS